MIDLIVGIIFIILLLGLVLCILFYIRNNRVFNYRTKICNKVYSFPVNDYKWRVEIMESVSYDEMFWKIWKPLDSFYPDKSFIKKDIT